MSIVQRTPRRQRGSELIGRLVIYGLGMAVLLAIGFSLIARHAAQEIPEHEFVFPVQPFMDFHPEPGVHCFMWILKPDLGYTQCTNGIHGLHPVESLRPENQDFGMGGFDPRGWQHGTLFDT